LQNIYKPAPRDELRRTPAEIAALIKVYPAGKSLPAAFLIEDWTQPSRGIFSQCLRRSPPPGPFQPGELRRPVCEAFLHDFDGDGREDILLVATTAYGGGVKAVLRSTAIFRDYADGSWRSAGAFGETICDSEMAALRAGSFQLVPAAHPDIQIGGRQIPLRWSEAASEQRCPENQP
jgi:hypothetical protein